MTRHQPRLYWSKNLRRRAGESENQDRPVQDRGHRHRPFDHDGRDHLQGADTSASWASSNPQAGRRAAAPWRRPAGRPGAREGLFHRPDRVRRCAADHAHRPPKRFRPRPLDLQMERRSQNAREVNAVDGRAASIWTNDLLHRATALPPRCSPGSCGSTESRRFGSARRSAATTIRHRPRGMLRGNAGLHAGKEHPREAAAGEVLASFRGRAQRGTRNP